MNQLSIRPTSLTGVKRLANEVKKAQQISHNEALNAAAVAAGFQNYEHARRGLQAGITQPRHVVVLICSWKDRKTNVTGKEALAIDISQPLAALGPIKTLQKNFTLCDFWQLGDNRLLATHLRSGQSEARRLLCAAARTLQFMDVTGLKPSKSHSRIHPKGSSNFRLPGSDHYRAWFDPATRKHLMTDEPYGDKDGVHSKQAEREAWAIKHDFSISKTKWPGMYAPDIGSRLYLVTRNSDGIPVQKIMRALDALPNVFEAENWLGISVPSMGIDVADSSLNKPIKAS